MKKTKTITIGFKTWQKLVRKKLESGMMNMTEVIESLFKGKKK